jgi:hypothetical protein
MKLILFFVTEVVEREVRIIVGKILEQFREPRR